MNPLPLFRTPQVRSPRLEIAAIKFQHLKVRSGSALNAKNNHLSCFHCVTKCLEWLNWRASLRLLIGVDDPC